jgi:hypothetical protein
MAVKQHGGLGTRVHADFFKDPFEIVANCFRLKAQCDGDFLVGLSVGNCGKHAAFLL